MLIIIISMLSLKLGHVGSKTRSLGQQATQVSDLGPLWPSCLHFGEATVILCLLLLRQVNIVFVTRRRWRGTIEMTLVCPCVHPSVHLSVIPSVCPHVRSCPRNSSYVFHRLDLKFYRLPSYHMKMRMWFLIFFAIFDKVMALADSYLRPTTPATSFIEWT